MLGAYSNFHGEKRSQNLNFFNVLFSRGVNLEMQAFQQHDIVINVSFPRMLGFYEWITSCHFIKTSMAVFYYNFFLIWTQFSDENLYFYRDNTSR